MKNEYLHSFNYVDLFNNEGDSKYSERINYVLMKLINSDTILTKKDCENNIDELKIIKDTIPSTNISNYCKKYWINFIDIGIRVVDAKYIMINKRELKKIQYWRKN